jgi:hypothetical protein
MVVMALILFAALNRYAPVEAVIIETES